MRGVSLLGSMGLLCLSACSTAPLPTPISLEEQIRKDSYVALEWVGKFDQSLRFRRDSTLKGFVQRLGRTLVQTSPALRDLPLEVYFIEPVAKVWRNYSLPGTRVYLSVGMLKTLEYDNELAALLALELGSVLSRHVLNHIEKKTEALDPRKLALDVGSGGVFSLDDQEQAQSLSEAVRILYEAGFDPRGLVGIWEKYRSQIEHSPFSIQDLDEFEEETRLKIVKYTPLRNPVVRTHEFVAMQRRIQAL